MASFFGGGPCLFWAPSARRVVTTLRLTYLAVGNHGVFLRG